MVCGSLEEMPEKSWVARLQSGLAALVAFSGVLMVNSTKLNYVKFYMYNFLTAISFNYAHQYGQQPCCFLLFIVHSFIVHSYSFSYS